jgi:2-keto-4-pentenoate hydratase
MIDTESLLDHLEKPAAALDPSADIINVHPKLTYEEAFALQLESVRRRVGRGDRLVGYLASLVSAGAQKTFPHIPAPMVGAILHSQMRDNGAAVELDTEVTLIEAEIAVLLNRDIEGDKLTLADILPAVEGYLPALEVVSIPPGTMERKWSAQHIVARQKAAGYVLLGGQITSPTKFDPRMEGAATFIDGELMGTAIGAESMGHPLHVVAMMARRLATAGEKLRAGQFIMTGSLPAPQRVLRGASKSARIEFTRLGNVEVRFKN